jgi:hypothetical protein
VSSHQVVEMSLDRLQALVTRQYQLQQTLGELPGDDATNEDRIIYLRTMVLACIDELLEALNETGWKPWALSDHINEAAAFGELSDALQFLLNAFFAVSPKGMTPEWIARAIDDRHMAKVKVNIARHEQGYDGVSTKCTICRRALDDEGVRCTRYVCYAHDDGGRVTA